MLPKTRRRRRTPRLGAIFRDAERYPRRYTPEEIRHAQVVISGTVLGDLDVKTCSERELTRKVRDLREVLDMLGLRERTD